MRPLRLIGNGVDIPTGTVTIGTTAPTYIGQTATVYEKGYWTDPNTGSFLDDLTPGGSYTDGIANPNVSFTIIIDSAGTPDTFKWQKNAGSFTTGVAITGAAQTLSNGVTVTFGATTGHTVPDQWVIGANSTISGTNGVFAGHSAFGAQAAVDQITDSTGTTYTGVPFVISVVETLDNVNQYVGDSGGLFVSVTSSNSQLAGASINGMESSATWAGSSGNPFAVRGATYTAYNRGSTTVAHLVGVSSFPSTQPGATSTMVEGFETHLSNSGGTITDWIGVHLNAFPFNDSVVTNQYGIKIEDINEGTNKWALMTGAGNVDLGVLKTTGAATGKKVVCVDTSNGRLYASSSGVACAN